MLFQLSKANDFSKLKKLALFEILAALILSPSGFHLNATSLTSKGEFGLSQ
jgi:hypothetical protein